MTTVADVLAMFEKLLIGTPEEVTDAQCCLRDICEEHGADSLQRAVSGHYYTVEVSRGHEVEYHVGLFTEYSDAVKAADEEAKEILGPLQIPRDPRYEEPGMLTKLHNACGHTGWIGVINKTEFHVPIYQDNPTGLQEETDDHGS